MKSLSDKPSDRNYYHETIIHLTRSEPKADSQVVRCPCHEDKNPSLRVSNRGDRIPLVYCIAQRCTFPVLKDYFTSVGVWPKWSTSKRIQQYHDAIPKPVPRYLEGLDHRKCKPVKSAEKFLREHVYTDAEFTPIYRKRKYSNGKWFFQHPHPDGNWYWGQGTNEKLMHDLPGLLWAIESNYPIIICEGEKDAERINSEPAQFIQATTPGSSSDWSDHFADLFIGYKRKFVLVVGHNDKAGEKFANKVSLSLQKRGILTSIFIPGKDEGKPSGYDLSDYIDDGGVV